MVEQTLAFYKILMFCVLCVPLQGGRSCKAHTKQVRSDEAISNRNAEVGGEGKGSRFAIECKYWSCFGRLAMRMAFLLAADIYGWMGGLWKLSFLHFFCGGADVLDEQNYLQLTKPHISSYVEFVNIFSSCSPRISSFNSLNFNSFCCTTQQCLGNVSNVLPRR